MKNACQPRASHVIFLLVASFVIIFWNLGANSLRDLDEALQGQIAKEIITAGDWLTLHIRNQPYFHKPPLIFWLNALSYRLFGFNEFAVRFFPALAGAGTILLVYFFSCSLYKNRAVGLFSSLILLTSSQFVFDRGARSGEEDMVLGFFILLTFFFLWRYEKKASDLYLAAISFGLAMLTKMPLCLPHGAVIVLFFTVARRSHRLGIRQVVRFLGAALILPGAWFALELVFAKQNFVKVYLAELVFFSLPRLIQDHLHQFKAFFGADVIARLNVPFPAEFPPEYYLKTLALGFFPWSILLIPAFVFLLWRSSKTEEFRDQDIFIGLWFFLPFCTYSFFANKSFWWLLPLLPAAAMAAAVFLKNLFSEKPVFFTVCGMLLACFGFLAPVQYRITGYSSITNLDQAFLQGQTLRWQVNPIFLGLAAAIMVISLLVSRKKLAGAFLAAYLFSGALFGAAIQAGNTVYRSDIDMIAGYLKANSGKEKIVVYSDDLYRMQYGRLAAEFPIFYQGGLVDRWGDYFYLNSLSENQPRFIKRSVGIKEDLSPMLDRNSATIFLIEEKDLAGFLASGIPAQLAIKEGRFVILRTHAQS